MSNVRYHDFEGTVPVDTRQAKPVPAGCGQNRWPERRSNAQPEAAEACTDIGADEPCRPPFSRVGLVLVLCTGLPLLVVICWALMAWLPPV